MHRMQRKREKERFLYHRAPNNVLLDALQQSSTDIKRND